MTKHELLCFFQEHKKSNLLHENQFKKCYPLMYNEISNLNFPDDFKWTQKLFHYLQDDYELQLGICSECGKRCTFITFGKGYSKYCSIKCSANAESVRNKYEETCLREYGVTNVSLNDDIKKKISKNNSNKIEKEIKNITPDFNITKYEISELIIKNPQVHSREYYIKSKYPIIYQEILDFTKFPEIFTFSQKLYHYIHDDINLELGKCKMCNKRCTFLSTRKGYDTFCSRECSYNYIKLQPKKLKKKQERKPKLSNFDYENSLSKLEVFELLKIKPNGNIERNIFKRKFPSLYQEILNINFPADFKWTQKLFHYFHDDFELKLGLCPMCGKRCGFIKFNKGYLNHCSKKCTILDENTKIKKENTCLNRYGVKNPFQSEDKKQKSSNTLITKYGVSHYSKTREFTLFRNKRVMFDDVYFDSSWEVEVYKFCKENNISCEYTPNKKFEYIYEGKKHFYNPDFLINGQYYEVKGDHFFKDGKMINPYDRSKDGLNEAKHQCMIKNNVIILKQKEIKNLKEVLLS